MESMVSPFGREVRRARIETKSTLRELSAFTGKGSGYQCGIECRRRKITDDDVAKVAEFFNKKGYTGIDWHKLAEESNKLPLLDINLEGNICMKQQKNIMLDIETMGADSNAAIISIGAVYFDENGLGEEFYRNVDFNSAMLAGGTVSASTIEWWLKQSEYARSSLLTNQKHIKDVLEAFTSFCDPEAKVWGNGVGFDNTILASAYKRMYRVTPWHHYNDRCYRTIKNLFPGIEMERIGIHHNALDDAKSQALHLIEIAKKHNIEL